jgi:hypothetical protein
VSRIAAARVALFGFGVMKEKFAAAALLRRGGDGLI